MSVCNSRHSFKNITSVEFYINIMFVDILPPLVRFQWSEHLMRAEDTFRVWDLFTARRQETFDVFYITDLHVWSPQIFKINIFLKRCCDRGTVRPSCLRSETQPWATSAQTWRKNSLFELLVFSRLFLHYLVAVQNPAWIKVPAAGLTLMSDKMSVKLSGHFDVTFLPIRYFRGWMWRSDFLIFFQQISTLFIFLTF